MERSRRVAVDKHHLESIMLSWALTFFVLAVIAAIFGFGGIAASAVGIGKILFFGFLILAVASALMGGLRGRKG